MSHWKLLTTIALALGVVLFVAVQARSKGTKAPTLTALDYAEIEQLNAHYAHALDTCADKGNEFADLFVPDGVYDGHGHKNEGHERLAALAGGPNCAPPKGPLNLHHVFVNTMIEPSAEGAIGKSYFLGVALGENGQTGRLTEGAKVYDVYVKTPAGWRFKSRTFVLSPQVDRIPASELSHHPLAH